MFALSLAQGQTTLRVPVFVTTESGRVPARVLNDRLAEEGYHLSIAEWLELRDTPMSRARVETLDANITSARGLLGGIYRDAERAFETAPADLNGPGLETCYQGDPAEVGDLAVSLSDSLYSEYFGLWGWRVRQRAVIFDDTDETRAYIRKKAPALWKEKIRDDSIYLLSRVTPDGLDLHVSRIKKCE